jgi:hypothetical protein
MRRDLESVADDATAQEERAAAQREQQQRQLEQLRMERAQAQAQVQREHTLGLSEETAKMTSALSASILQLELLCLSLPASLSVKDSPTSVLTAPWKHDDAAQLEQV